MFSECKKLVYRRESLILLLLTILFMSVLLGKAEAPSPKMMKCYREKIAEYRMPFSEAVPMLESELNTLGDVGEDVNSSSYIQYATISNLLASASKAEQHNADIIEILKKLDLQIDSAPTEYIRRDLELAYVHYNRAYKYHVFPPEMILGVWYCENSTFTYLYLILLIAFLGSLFTIENENGMYQILYACKLGKKGVFLRKYSAAVICIVFIAFFFTAVSSVGGWMKHGLSLYLLSEPIQCLDEFAMCPFKLTVGMYILLLFLMRSLVGVFILSLICLFSAFIKKGVTVFGFTAFISFISLISVSDKIPANISYNIRKIGICGLLEPQKYISEYNTVNVFGTPVMSFYLAIGCTLAISFFISVLAYALFVDGLKGGKKHA